MDPTSTLEQRLENLIGHIGHLQAEGSQMRKRLAELEQKASDFKRLQETNSKMLAEIKRLESELRQADVKESQVRTRLEGILKKIDSLEEAIAGREGDKTAAPAGQSHRS